MTEVCVVHLVWAPLGAGPVERFAASYRQHPAGMEHRLVVLLNGFGDGEDPAGHLRPLDGLDFETLQIRPAMLDLPAYARAARAIDASHLCFLNSHSAPLGPGWLAALHDALGRGVGLAGATGSYEAPRTINPLRGRRWPRFPNPHVRTNGFILECALMRSLLWPDAKTKSAAWELESGRAGMTRQVWARGFRAVVVGRSGTVHPPESWPDSATFRSGGQVELLVADNRTRQWEEAGPAERARLSRLAWGAAPASAAAQVRAALAVDAPEHPSVVV